MASMERWRVQYVGFVEGNNLVEGAKLYVTLPQTPLPKYEENLLVPLAPFSLTYFAAKLSNELRNVEAL